MKMRAAQGDIFFSDSFAKDLNAWASEHWTEIYEQSRDEVDPSGVWERVSKALYDIAREHFGATKNTPRGYWLKPDTWDMIAHQKPYWRIMADENERNLHIQFRENMWEDNLCLAAYFPELSPAYVPGYFR